MMRNEDPIQCDYCQRDFYIGFGVEKSERNPKLNFCSKYCKEMYNKKENNMIDYDSTLNNMSGASLAIGEAVVEKEPQENSKIAYDDNIQVKGPNVFDLAVAKSRMDAGNVHELVAKADAFIMETDEDASYGTEIAMQSRKLSNSIEKARKSIVAPHISFQKAIKQYSDEFTKCLKEIEQSITKKIGIHQKKKEDALRKEFEAKQKIERERVAAENKKIADENARIAKENALKEKKEVAPLKKEIEQPQEQVFIPPTQKVSTDSGTMMTVVTWEFEIEDEKLIPRGYLHVNERTIKDAIRMGERLIPGVKIYEKKSIRSRVK